jgi:hypothetical protein
VCSKEPVLVPGHVQHFVTCLNDYRIDNKGILRISGRQDNKKEDLEEDQTNLERGY